MMRSNQPRQPEEARSSLEDSSYEVLGESLCEVSDDEGNTESLASTTPDDVSSISDDDEFGDDEYANETSQHLFDHETYSPHDHFPTNASSPNASMMTSMADTQTDEGSYIKLEEYVTKDGSADARGIVSRFTEARGLPQVLRGYRCPDLRLTVQMSLSERYLPVPRSYRILYVGEFPEWGVKEINARIGAALDATPSSSRFNIVQGPAYPGSPSSSNVQLERSGLELVVDHCTTPKTIEEDGRPSRALITLDDGTELTFGPGKAIRFKGQSSSISLPDLVIFCHYTVPSESDTAEETERFRLTRESLNRHSIPCLDIATTRPYGKCPDSFSYDDHSLRLCMQGRNTPSQDYEDLETLPIDIYAFSSIDPSELNRHLAFITPQSASSELRHEQQGAESWKISKVVSAFGTTPSTRKDGARIQLPSIWVAFLALSATVAIYLSGYGPFYLLSPQSLSKRAENYPTSLVLEPSLSGSSQITLQPKADPPPKPLRVPSISRDVAVLPCGNKQDNKQYQSQRGRSSSSKESPLGGLTVEVKGPQQFIIRPTKQFNTGKRNPQIDVQVTRESENVPIQVTYPKEGDMFYTVNLQYQYSRGTFDINVVLRRKPLLQQSFVVELGQPKSDIIKYIAGAQYAQDGLWGLGGQLAEAIDTGLAALEDGAHAAVGHTRQWKEFLQHSSQSVADHLDDARQEAIYRLRIGSRVTNEASSRLLQRYRDISTRMRTDLWDLSAPVRQSAPIRRAHNNAGILRKKFEKRESKITERKAKGMDKRAKSAKQQKQVRGKV